MLVLVFDSSGYVIFYRRGQRLGLCSSISHPNEQKISKAKATNIFFIVDESKDIRNILDLETGLRAQSKPLWNRVNIVKMIAKGLSENDKAQILVEKHRLEAIDLRHRYGLNLNLYYKFWRHESGSTQDFFSWLDKGDGKEFNHLECPRTVLEQQRVTYLDSRDRKEYEVLVENGKFYTKSKALLDTPTHEGSKWIYVLSPERVLYVSQKRKGYFHHSSFLAGGATLASGQLTVLNGTLKAIGYSSGHYHPTKENFIQIRTFLKERRVDLTNVKKLSLDGVAPAVTDKELKTRVNGHVEMNN